MSRTREQVIWDFVQNWLRKAETDLRAAEHLLTIDQEDYFPAAFHAQQAAEKFLKGFLSRHQIPFPKTHDIGRPWSWLRSRTPPCEKSWPRPRCSPPLVWSFAIRARKL